MLDSGTTGSLNLFRKESRGHIALYPQSTRDDQRVLLRWVVEEAQIP
jgi:hypothetical protein